jgi:hypothetical protein
VLQEWQQRQRQAAITMWSAFKYPGSRLIWITSLQSSRLPKLALSRTILHQLASITIIQVGARLDYSLQPTVSAVWVLAINPLDTVPTLGKISFQYLQTLQH